MSRNKISKFSKEIILIFFLGFSFSSKLISQCSCNCDVERDSLALVAFKNSTSGASISWNTSEPLEEWSGITLNEDRCVIKFWRGNKGIYGQIPPEIGNLECLTDLRLADNNMTGNIPSEIGNLLCLTRLSLSINEFSGEIPPEIGNLENLESLGLNINDFTGIIPNSIGNLSNLSSLALQNNHLEGCIPEEFMSFCEIDYFNLDGNGRLAFLGHVEDFCAGDNQIGSVCWTDGQYATIDENCNCTTTTNTTKINNSENFKVFPNPFSKELIVESDQFLIHEIRVYNTVGAIQFKQKHSLKKYEMNLKNFVPGIYFVEVFFENRSEVFTIVKE